MLARLLSWDTFVYAIFLGLLMMALAGCAGKSTITKTYFDDQGRKVTEVQEITDEAAFVQAQKDARKPTLKITASDPSQPMTLANVASLEVYGGSDGGIRQYVHPGWDVAKTAFGVIGTVAGVYVAMDGATKLVGAVAGVGGNTFTDSFNASGTQSTVGYTPGNGSILTASPTTTSTTSDRHDVTSTMVAE